MRFALLKLLLTHNLPEQLAQLAGQQHVLVSLKN